MQAVSLFPSLFDFQLLGVFAIRVSLGMLLIYFWYKNASHAQIAHFSFLRKINSKYATVFSTIMVCLEGVVGILLLFGLYTQGAAIVAGILMLVVAFLKWKKIGTLENEGIEFYLVLSVVSFSLLFLGPGVFAIDLPL